MGKYRSLLKLMVAGAALSGCLAGGAAPASATINLGGYTGPVSIHFQNFESLYDSAGNLLPNTAVPTAGDQLIGVLSITSIFSTTTSQLLWAAGLPGDGFLLGTFVGPTISTFNPVSGAFTSTTPWSVNLYSSAAQYTPAQGTAGFTNGGCGGPLTGCYNGINDATSLAGGNTLQLDIQSAPGVDLNPAVISDGTFSLASLSGSNFYDANVLGGAAAAQFDSNGVPTVFPGVFTDFNINSDFCQQSSSPGPGQSCNGNNVIGDWRFVSNDPVVGNAIPEPGSLTLLGGGLLTLAAWSRRRRRAYPKQA